MTKLAPKFGTSKAAPMIFRAPAAVAFGGENCVNFGLDLRANPALVCGVVCVNFGAYKMLLQDRP